MDTNRDIFRSKGTIGIGDVMYHLGVAHRWAHDHNRTVEIHFHWSHDEDYNYHFEDPETIIEKANYIQQFYYNKDQVIIKHIFNYNFSSDEELNTHRLLINGERCIISYMDELKKRITDEDTTYRRPNWLFDPRFKQKTNKNKVILWRSLFNADVPQKWKIFENNDIIQMLESYDYNVVEVDYRTPIREVMWHINTCDFCVGYDGMWHYVAQNFMKPMYIFSNNILTELHTPGALYYGGHRIERYRKFFLELDVPKPQNIDKFKRFFKGKERIISNHKMLHWFANEHEKTLYKEIGYEDRQSSN